MIFTFYRRRPMADGATRSPLRMRMQTKCGEITAVSQVPMEFRMSMSLSKLTYNLVGMVHGKMNFFDIDSGNVIHVGI